MKSRLSRLVKPGFWVGATVLLALLATSCSDAPAAAPEVPLEELGPNASIIRNPVASPEIDPESAATMVFAETEYDFGTVAEGEVVRHTYAFTNTGRVPLIITDARSTCGCTVPTYPKEPIGPGESGEIDVEFNTAGKGGNQSKPVSVTANTYPATTTVYISGRVEKK